MIDINIEIGHGLVAVGTGFTENRVTSELVSTNINFQGMLKPVDVGTDIRDKVSDLDANSPKIKVTFLTIEALEVVEKALAAAKNLMLERKAKKEPRNEEDSSR